MYYKFSLNFYRGIAGNAALVAALHQSFAQQTQFLSNTFQIDQGENKMNT